jgi:sec-independent protein translocase protein TatC
VADLDPIDRARRAVTDRAELPGMSLMEHLGELRKRLIHSAAYLLVGFIVAYVFHERLYGYVQKPLSDLHIALNFTHPTDGLNLYLKVAFLGGAILASPFILYQVWLFISPGMYANEKRYVVPFMGATIGLFFVGAWFGYRWVLPGALKVLILDFGKNFHPIITIEDYTGFFLAIILGLGITFELPILIFFLALFGIVDARFLVKHFRYAILIIFLIAAIICPMPDPYSMCLFAAPMLVLYVVGVGVAFLVHPARRKAREKTPA